MKPNDAGSFKAAASLKYLIKEGVQYWMFDNGSLISVLKGCFEGSEPAAPAPTQIVAGAGVKNDDKALSKLLLLTNISCWDEKLVTWLMAANVGDRCVELWLNTKEVSNIEVS